MIELLLLPIFTSFLSLMDGKKAGKISVMGAFVILASFFFLKDGYLQYGILVDEITKVFYIILSSISLLVFVYSLKYIRKNLRRYWFFMNLFLLSMLLLILSTNLLIIMISWELLSLCSWALISHNFRNPETRRKARRVFMVTSISDIFFLLSIFIIIAYSGNFDIYKIDGKTFEEISKNIPIFPILLSLGILGKSAQFPFYFWLLDAMAGPSTVSALLHSSTMVKAGAYLSMRILSLFELSSFSRTLLIFGTISCVLSLILSIFERRIKRFLAYSTIANLGLIFMAVGSKRIDLALLHSLSHSFFKSSLFLLYPFFFEKDVFKAGIPRNISTIILLSIFLSFVGIPPFLSYFTESSIIKEFLPFSYPLSFLLHFYSMRFSLSVFSRKGRSVKMDERAIVIYTLGVLNLLLTFIPLLKGFKVHPDIFLIPIAFLLSYKLYWKKKRPSFEKILDRFSFDIKEIAPSFPKIRLSLKKIVLIILLMLFLMNFQNYFVLIALIILMVVML